MMDNKLNVKLEANPSDDDLSNEEGVLTTDFLGNIKNESNISGNEYATDNITNINVGDNVPGVNLQTEIPCSSTNLKRHIQRDSTTSNYDFEMYRKIRIKEEPGDAEFVSLATARNDTFSSLDHLLKIKKETEDTDDSDIERTETGIDYQSEVPLVSAIYQEDENEGSALENKESAEDVSSSESPRLTSEAVYHDSRSLTFSNLEKDVACDLGTVSGKNPNKKSPMRQNSCFPNYNQTCDVGAVDLKSAEKVGDESIPVYQCEVCEKNFKSKFVLNRHYLCHSERKPYKCDSCQKCFSRKCHFQRHTLLHSGIKPYKCNSCDKCFTRKSFLDTHKLIHSGLKPYKCDRCDKCFREKATLKRHTLFHLGAKAFKCDSCDKSFVDKKTLNRHKFSHSGTKPYKCDDCDKCFTERSALRRHKMLHSDIKPYKCDSCDKSFTENSALRRHILLHSGTKPFKCDTCGKSFIDKSTLNRHMLFHSDTKPYKCNSCEKSFTQRSHLQQHTLFHSGIKPYKCDSCDKSFTRKSRLDAHILLHSVSNT